VGSMNGRPPGVLQWMAPQERPKSGLCRPGDMEGSPHVPAPSEPPNYLFASANGGRAAPGWTPIRRSPRPPPLPRVSAAITRRVDLGSTPQVVSYGLPRVPWGQPLECLPISRWALHRALQLGGPRWAHRARTRESPPATRLHRPKGAWRDLLASYLTWRPARALIASTGILDTAPSKGSRPVAGRRGTIAKPAFRKLAHLLMGFSVRVKLLPSTDICDID